MKQQLKVEPTAKIQLKTYLKGTRTLLANFSLAN